MAQKPKKVDPIDALAAGPLENVVMLMLWKDRLRQPDLFVNITAEDIKGFEDSMRYMKVKPTLVVKRPEGVPEQQAIPAQGNRRAVPYRAAIPPRPYVLVTILEEGTEHGIRPVENNEADYDRAQAAAAVRKARDQAPRLAEDLLRQARTGEFSLSEIQDAANALVTLARAVA